MDATQANNLIKQCYDDKCVTINGHDYTFLKTTHDKRLKVFSYLMGVQKKMTNGDLSFMGEDGWKNIVNLMSNIIMIDGDILSRKKDHWENEEYSPDYIKLMLTSLQVISYPLLSGGV